MEKDVPRMKPANPIRNRVPFTATSFHLSESMRMMDDMRTVNGHWKLTCCAVPEGHGVQGNGNHDGDIT